jgi:hypothetical protein
MVKQQIIRQRNLRNSSSLKAFFLSRRFEIMLGVYLILSSLYDQIISYIHFGEFVIFWFCDFAALLLGLGILFRTRFSQIIPNIILITVIPAQFLWILDFFLQNFDYGLGRTALLYSYGAAVFYGSLNLHAILIPSALFLTYRNGFSKNCFWYGFWFVFILLSTSFFVTDPALNVNCVFYSCDMVFGGLSPDYDFASHFIGVLAYWLFLYVIFYFVHLALWSGMFKIWAFNFRTTLRKTQFWKFVVSSWCLCLNKLYKKKR